MNKERECRTPQKIYKFNFLKGIHIHIRKNENMNQNTKIKINIRQRKQERIEYQ